MCLAPKMPPPPEPPPPAPTPVTSGTTPTTIRPTTSKRASMRQAAQGPSSLNIPLGGGATGAAPSSMTNLSIGK
jgi:hypothetical protein